MFWILVDNRHRVYSLYKDGELVKAKTAEELPLVDGYSALRVKDVFYLYPEALQGLVLQLH